MLKISQTQGGMNYLASLKSGWFSRQEVQLSQRDRSALLVIEYFAKLLKKITQGHSKRHYCKGKGLSRSLKMALFDISYTTFYWLAIVSIAL